MSSLNLFKDSRMNPSKKFKSIKQRLFDIYKHEISSFTISSKSVLYQYLVDNFCLQSYLGKSISPEWKNVYRNFECHHTLWILIRVNKSISRKMRLYECCVQTDIEDKFHFILKCPHYIYLHLRIRYIKSFYYTKPSVFKLIKLLCVDNTNELNNLRNF